MRRFLEVAQVIRGRVDDGTYPKGKRIPGVRPLAEDLGVARPTVSEALNYLVGEGVLEVRAQSGHYPAENPHPGRFVVDLNTIRRHPRGYLLSAGTGDWEPTSPPAVLGVPCPAPVAVMLSEYEHQVEAGAAVVARRRSVGPGYPVQLTTTYLAPSLVAELPVVGAVDTGPGGWIDRVEEHFDAPFEGRWFATSRTPQADEARELGVTGPLTLPWVTEVRRLISVSGRPVAVEVVVWDARRVELMGEMRRDTTATWPVEPATMRNSPGP